MSNPAKHLGILIIDLQDTFLNAIPDSESLIRRNKFLVEAARLLGSNIALTEQIPEKLGQTTDSIRQLLPETTPVFEKSSFSALDAVGIHRWIESNQIDHLLLAGIETTICIYQTAVQALGEDIGITLISDCIGERRPEDREPVLKQLLTMEAHVLPAETVLYSLVGSADHPDFKEFTELVKKYST